MLLSKVNYSIELSYMINRGRGKGYEETEVQGLLHEFQVLLLLLLLLLLLFTSLSSYSHLNP